MIFWILTSETVCCRPYLPALFKRFFNETPPPQEAAPLIPSRPIAHAVEAAIENDNLVCTDKVNAASASVGAE